MSNQTATITISDACWPFLDSVASSSQFHNDQSVNDLGVAFDIRGDHPRYVLTRSELETLRMLASEAKATLAIRYTAGAHPVICQLEIHRGDYGRRTASAVFSLSALINRIDKSIADLEEDEPSELTPEPITWKCQICGTTVTTLLPVLSAPTCSRHTGGGKLMIQKVGK